MKEVNLQMPTKWDQLKRKQILYIARLFLAKLNNQDFRIRAFFYLTGLKALPKRSGQSWWFKKGKQKFKLDEQELVCFLKSTDYLAQDSKLTVNHFPSFRLPFKRFFGPSAKCNNVIYLEFIHAELCLYAFQRTDKIKYLNQLCAVLYRPEKENYDPMHPDFNGDRREKFNDFIYQKRAWRFKLLSMRKRFVVYLFYIGSRNVMIETFSDLFSGGSVSSEPVNPVKSLRKIIYDLNQGDPTKNEKLYGMQIREAFEFLDEMIKRTPKPKKNGKV